MSDSEQDKKEKKEAMKELRESRKTYIKSSTAKMKIQKKAIKAIEDHLKEGAWTVPEIAAAAGISAAKALWYVATLKKYGVIKEAEKDGSYFKYELPGVVEPAEATD
jgi:predicted transcriptional regulator